MNAQTFTKGGFACTYEQVIEWGWKPMWRDKTPVTKFTKDTRFLTLDNRRNAAWIKDDDKIINPIPK